MTLVEMIIKYREEHGLSQRQFSKACNLSNAYISILENGKNPRTKKPITPTLLALKKIATGMGMTLDELLRSIDDTPLNIADDTDGDNYTFEGIDNLIQLPAFKKVPLIGEIACGKPILANEEAIDLLDMPDGVNADCALRCKGDSMIGARIFDGDLVFIRRQPYVENGEIAAVIIDDEATLKRVYHFPDHLLLQPENPAHKPIVLWEKDIETVHILGKAVAFVSPVY